MNISNKNREYCNRFGAVLNFIEYTGRHFLTDSKSGIGFSPATQVPEIILNETSKMSQVKRSDIN
jgi:hypothetical protein